jgi:FPC/CPF motif-containing protein YcgG
MTHDPQRAADDSTAREVFDAIVGGSDYPCLGARSVWRQGRATVRGSPRLGTAGSAGLLLEDLAQFASATDLSAGFTSFVAVFFAPCVPDEQCFERLLWRQLGTMRSADSTPPDPEVSDDPADPRFAFSAAGTAYFVVGLHPVASRPARRAPLPVLVFNPHHQFEQLRAAGRFERLRDTIRRRDEAANGSINPMVADHGADSEARQYSGRWVDDGWVAPLSGAPDQCRMR